MLHVSEGRIEYKHNNKPLPLEDVYRQVSFCAPYMEVIEEMTVLEFLEFHQQFKPLLAGFTPVAVVKEVGLQAAAQKQIRYYSSGMKQRVKLAQAFFSDTAAVLLDEPCSNLDATGIELYHRLVKTFGAGRLLVVCSNDSVEYNFCDEILSIASFK